MNSQASLLSSEPNLSYDLGQFLARSLAPLRRNFGAVAQVLLALLVLSLAQSIFLILVGPFMRALFMQDLGFLSLKELLPLGTLAWVPQEVQAIKVPREVLVLAVPSLLVLAGIIKAVASYVYHLSQQVIAIDIAEHLRAELFSSLLRQPYEFIMRRSPGTWMSTIMNDVMYLQTRFSEVASSLLRDGVLIVSCFLALLVIHWATAVVLLVAAPFLIVGMGRIGRRIAVFAAFGQSEVANMAAAVLDMRRRFTYIRAQGGEDRELFRFAALNSNYYRLIRKSIVVRSAFAPSLEFFGFLVFAGAIYWLTHGTTVAAFGPDRLIQFFAALGLLLRPLRTIGEQMARFEETKGALVAPAQLLARGDESGAQAGHAAASLRSKGPDRGRFAGLTIRSIVCGQGGHETLRASNMVLAPGRAIALVGRSGAGKSTLLKTLGGLLPPWQWQASQPWSELVAGSNLVSQFPFLFEGSLRDNLLYGVRRDRAISDECLEAALVTVNMRDAVMAAGGLDTEVRAIGTAFSGGQIQRLVIARALVREESLWLFDEATSALDPGNEAAILSHLVEACRSAGNTLLAVSHRTGSLPNFDEVWFLGQGHFIAQGTHQALLQREDYARFVAGIG